MRTFSFPALFKHQDEGGFVVTFRDVPEAITQGDSLVDAMRSAEDALEEAIAGRIAHHEGIPQPSEPHKLEHRVSLPASMALKAALYLTLEELQFNNTEIALQLGIDEREVRRLLDPRHPTKLSRIETILHRFGKRVVVGLETRVDSERASFPSATPQQTAYSGPDQHSVERVQRGH